MNSSIYLWAYESMSLWCYQQTYLHNSNQLIFISVNRCIWLWVTRSHNIKVGTICFSAKRRVFQLNPKRNSCSSRKSHLKSSSISINKHKYAAVCETLTLKLSFLGVAVEWVAVSSGSLLSLLPAALTLVCFVPSWAALKCLSTTATI